MSFESPHAADWLEVESLDLDGQGVAHRPAPDTDDPAAASPAPDAASPSAGAGKVVFIEGALPGERVQVDVVRRKRQWEQGQVTAIDRESSQRVRPRCPHFGLHRGACGGCKIQHLHPAAQVAVKQRVLEDQLWHLAKVRPGQMLRPIEGPAWGYRCRARLSVRFVPRKGEVLVGFHERKSRYVADMASCAVLPPAVSALLPALRALVAGMDGRDRLPQIELAMGDTVTALVLRHLEPLSDADLDRLHRFGDAHGVQWWLQPKGPDTVHPLDPTAAGRAPLAYALPEFDVHMPFAPTDFTQINPQINRVLVSRAMRLLDVNPGQRVIDWFCGLGNFTLPLARQAGPAGRVLGIEGSAALVTRATANAALNGLAGQASFEVRNLFELTPTDLLRLGAADRWLVDPPREGAFALAKVTADLVQGGSDWAPPRRIVVVSCNPATLARDAGLLVHQAGYRCSAAGVVNMFPHTAHVESIAVFDRADRATAA
jgi:23S rRNA (uracil1939-C5)-methyltransferase